MDTFRRQVAFVANFELTPTLHAVATGLEAAGCDVHWFCFSRKWQRWLIRNGTAPSRVVLLRSSRGGDHDDDDNATGLPKNSPDEPPLPTLAARDRVLRWKPAAQALRLLQGYATQAKREVRSRRISAVFGESTWSSEVAVSYALKELGVPYLSPIPTRVPSGRVAFALAPLQAELIMLDDTPCHEFRVQAEREYQVFLSKSGGPLWSHNQFSVARYMREPLMWFRRLLVSVFDSAGNPTQLGPIGYLRAKNPVTLAWNARRLRRLMDRHAVQDPSGIEAPYVLMPLQVQPEASVDVVAWRGADQLRNIQAVALAVPDGVKVAVKEHSHRFGSRNSRFFDRALAMDNVILVAPTSDGSTWAEKAQMVIAPSGTMCLENALAGRPAAVMAPIFFDQLARVQVIPEPTPTHVRAAYRAGLDDAIGLDPVEYLEWIIQRSLPGMFTAEADIPGSLSDANIRNLVAAFLAALEAVWRA